MHAYLESQTRVRCRTFGLGKRAQIDRIHLAMDVHVEIVLELRDVYYSHPAPD